MFRIGTRVSGRYLVFGQIEFFRAFRNSFVIVRLSFILAFPSTA